MSRIIRSSDVITINDDSVCRRKADSIVEKSMEEARLIIRDAAAESESMLEESRIEAERIVSEALAESKVQAEALLEESRTRGYDEGRREGYEVGYAEGHAKGLDEAYGQTAEERATILEEANEIKRGYLQERDRILSEIEPEVIRLVKEISEKIVYREMDDDTYMVDLILKGLSSLNDKDSLIIRVSKDDYESVVELKPEILAKGSLIDDIDIKLDSNLAKGDCVIESSQGSVNSSVSLQMEEMKKILDDLLLGE